MNFSLKLKHERCLSFFPRGKIFGKMFPESEKFTIVGQRKEQLELHFIMCWLSPVRHVRCSPPLRWIDNSRHSIYVKNESSAEVVCTCSSEQTREGMKLLISVIPWLPEVAGLNIALLFPLFPPETFHPVPDSERAGVSPSKSLAAPAPQLVWANSCWIRPC